MLSSFDDRMRELLDLTRVVLRRAELGSGHVREHCQHASSGRSGCDACEARWQAALAADAIRRGCIELLAAADNALLASIKLHRAAVDWCAVDGCRECEDIVIDAAGLRDELAEAVGLALQFDGAVGGRSELRYKRGERHVETARDPEQREG